MEMLLLNSKSLNSMLQDLKFYFFYKHETITNIEVYFDKQCEKLNFNNVLMLNFCKINYEKLINVIFSVENICKPNQKVSIIQKGIN